MKNILICLFLLVALQIHGQVLNRANGSFNLIVNDSTVLGEYYVTGLFNDFTMEYAGTEITFGDYLWTNTCKRYLIEAVIAAPGSTSGVMKLRVSDPDGYGVPAGGVGAVMSETATYLFPLTTSNISENLQSCIQTHFAVKVDANAGGTSETFSPRGVLFADTDGSITEDSLSFRYFNNDLTLQFNTNMQSRLPRLDFWGRREAGLIDTITYYSVGGADSAFLVNQGIGLGDFVMTASSFCQDFSCVGFLDDFFRYSVNTRNFGLGAKSIFNEPVLQGVYSTSSVGINVDRALLENMPQGSFASSGYNFFQGEIYVDSIFTREEIMRNPGAGRDVSRTYLRGNSAGASSVPFFMKQNEFTIDTIQRTINRPLETVRNNLLFTSNRTDISILGVSGTSAVQTNRARLPVWDSVKVSNLVISQSVALFENPTSRFNGQSVYREIALNRSAFVLPDTAFSDRIGAAFGNIIDMAHTANPSTRKPGLKNIGVYITRGTRASSFEYVEYGPTAPSGDWIVYSALPWASRLDSLGLGGNPTEKLEVFGVTKTNGLRTSIVNVTGDITLTKANYTVIANAMSGEIDVTLPDPTTVTGSIFCIKKTDATNDVIILPFASETIDGLSSLFLVTQNQTALIQSDGTNWWILARN